MVVLGLVLSSARPQDATWSRFRGPNGTGVADTTGLPVEFGPDKNVVWRTPLPPGHSSPVLSARHVFLTAVEEKKLLTYCLNRATGEVLWRREAPRPRISKLDRRNHAAAATPAVDARTVVVFFQDFGMLAYDHAGRELWRLPLGPFDNVYGMGASPVLIGDRALLACDQSTGSFVIAVSKADGKVLFKVDRPHAKSGHSTPIVYAPEEGAPQLVLPGSFSLDAYDIESGERVWLVRGLSFEMKSTPVLVDGVIYINGYGSPFNQPGNQLDVPVFEKMVAERDGDGDGLISKKELRGRARMFFDFVDLERDGKLNATDWSYLRAALASKNGVLAIKAGGKDDMTARSTLWSYRRSVPQLPSPLVYRGVLYLLNDQSGILVMLRPADGAVIRRARLEQAIDDYYASPVAADGKVFVVSEQGLVSVLRAGEEFEVLAVNDLADTCYATPAIADGRIYLRTRGMLYCFGRAP